MKRILIPVDFSDLARYALEMAEKMQVELEAELHFVHVITLPSHIYLKPDGSLMDDGEMTTSGLKNQQEQAALRLKSWTNGVKAAHKEVVLFGHVNETTLNYVKTNGIDMIVMGTHGAHGMKELLTGSHAEYLAMHADAPVLSIKGATTQMDRMLLASDFTADMPSRVELLLALKKAFNARLYLLQVQLKGKKRSEVAIQEKMSAFAEKHDLEDVYYAIYPAHDLEEGIVRFAAEQQIGLIAIGSMQRTGLNRILNGCISADLVNHVDKPIFTFKLQDH
jgi:nucleotide-binding universal stress UspA family protein